jgi:hypothetical protein
MRLDRRQRLEQLVGSFEHPRDDARQVLAEEGVCAARAELAGDLVDERAGGRGGHDDHLPPGLDPNAGVDEDPGVLLEPGVAHVGG